MRLIDADKLIEICDKGWRLGSAINTQIYHTVDASDIRSQPTVEAIPIEWLKQREEKHKNDPCYCMFVSKEILADWEKENEKEIDRH